MDRSRALRWSALAFGTVLLACDGTGADGLATRERDGAPDAVFGDDIITAAARADGTASAGATAPRRIYYDLTIFDWYRHGEPLVLDGGQYQPDGTPRAIRADRMRRIGEYRGVDVYVPDGAQPPHGVVFVPVFGRYWQPFLLRQRGPVRAD